MLLLFAVLHLRDTWAAEHCPTVADEISTDRPDVTNSSTVVPHGSLQVENGVNLARQNRSTVVDGSNTRLRFGFSECIEAVLDLPNYTRSSRDGEISGLSDIAPAIKVQLQHLPQDMELSAVAGITIPTGAVAVSGNGYGAYLQSPWSIDIGGGWGIHGMDTVFWTPSRNGDHVVLEQTLSFEHEVGPHADLFAEYVGDYPTHASPAQILNFGGAYRFTPKQQIDFHTGFGINRRSPSSFFGLGYSLRWDEVLM